MTAHFPGQVSGGFELTQTPSDHEGNCDEKSERNIE